MTFSLLGNYCKFCGLLIFTFSQIKEGGKETPTNVKRKHA
jgi:hypothetical protein